MAGKGAPRRVDGLEGIVVKGAFGGGSKSEREAIYLDVGDEKLVLRRKDGPSFGDTALDRYVGKRVKCRGFVTDYMLLVEHIDIVD